MSFEGKKLGKYVLKSKLGQGGMGIVFLAVQEGLEREVALKVLPERNLERSKDLLKRFLKEASVCARISHPNIIKVYDYGYEAGAYYYAMEVLRATSLEDHLQKTPIPSFDFTMRIARDMVSAFEAYHPLSVVHRDIKPANILLDDRGKAILTDFGLVKDLLASGVTREGAAVGTPYYMAPEQVKGQVVDAATDIYQLGVMLYRMVAGRLPFKSETGSSADVFRQILTVEPVPPSKHNPKVSPQMETVILNCMEKDRAVRYRSAEELREDLELAARRAPVTPRRELAAAGQLGEASAPAAAPGSSGRLRVPAGSRATSTVPMTLGTPAPARGPAWAGPAVRVLLMVLVPLLAFGLVWLRYRRADYSAMDVVTKVGSRRAVVEWQSPSEYAGRVDWGEPGSESRMAVLDSPGRLTHKVELEALAPGKSYRFCIIFPDGKKSLEYTFETPAAPIVARGLEAGARALELVFDTAVPVEATLSSGGKKASDSSAVTAHRLKLEGVDAARDPLELTFRDAAGDEVRLGREELLALFRKAVVPRLVPSLVKGLQDLSIDQFVLTQMDRQLPPEVCRGAMSSLEGIGIEGAVRGERRNVTPRYLHFRDGDERAAAIARVARDFVATKPFARELAELTMVGRGLFDERLLSVSQTAALLTGLQKLRDFDYYTAFLNIPYATGVEGIFGRDFKVRLESQLQNAKSEEVTIPGNTAWGHPYKEYLLAEKAGLDPGAGKLTAPFDWRPSLPDPSRWQRAELALVDVRLEYELMFQVTVNGNLVLNLRHPPERNVEGKETRVPMLVMGIDPRLLRSGENHFHVEITNTPGTRYIGLKRQNNLKMLRLSWE